MLGVEEMKHRVIVCTDIRGIGEPDDSFSLAHLLCFQEQLDLLGFVISRPAGTKKAFNEILNAFEVDKETYGFNSNTAFVVMIGAKEEAPQCGYSKATEASRFIIEEARKDELVVLNWGSCNETAQAVHDAPEIIPNLKVFLGGVNGYNYEKDPAPYEYLRKIPELFQIWTNEAGKGMNVWTSGGPKYSPTGFVERVLKPCGKLGKYLAKLAPHTTYDGLKCGDTQGVIFTMDDGWSNPAKKTRAGKYQHIKGTNHYVDVKYGSKLIERLKILKEWEAWLTWHYGEME